MAVSAVDEASGRVRLAHVLSPLPPRVEAAQHVEGRSGAEEAESLSAVQGSSFAREKCAPARHAAGWGGFAGPQLGLWTNFQRVSCRTGQRLPVCGHASMLSCPLPA